MKQCLSTIAGDNPADIENDKAPGALDGLHQFTAPTLPHLIALLTHSSASFPPPNTSLFVIDNVSALFSAAFPRLGDKSSDQQTAAKKSQNAQWATSRRWAIMEKVISDLRKMAVTKNMAIIVIGQMATRVRDEARAMLHPAIAGDAWEGGIATRIVLYRDWLSKTSDTASQATNYSGARFASVIKARNVSYGEMSRLTAFRITRDGLEELPIDAAHVRGITSPTVSSTVLKRKHNEVADSESEERDPVSDNDFGWDAEVAQQADHLNG